MQEAAVNHEFKKQQLHCKNEHWDQSLTQGNHSHWPVSWSQINFLFQNVKLHNEKNL